MPFLIRPTADLGQRDDTDTLLSQVVDILLNLSKSHEKDTTEARGY